MSMAASISSARRRFLKQKLVDMQVHEYRADGLYVKCYWCPAWIKAGEKSLTIDHVVPKRSGGTNQQGNLVLACRRCNWRRNHEDQVRGNGRGPQDPAGGPGGPIPYDPMGDSPNASLCGSQARTGAILGVSG